MATFVEAPVVYAFSGLLSFLWGTAAGYAFYQANPNAATYGIIGWATTLTLQFNHETTALIPVARAGYHIGSVTVQVVQVGGTAVAGVDYNLLTPSLAWGNGDGALKYVKVQFNSLSADKTLVLRLTNPLMNGQTGFAAVFTPSQDVTITAQRVLGPAGLIGFAETEVMVDESSTPSFDVWRFEGRDLAVSVDWETEDDTAIAGVDYTAASGTANWADLVAGKVSIGPITVNAVGANKRFKIVLSNPQGGATLDEERDVLGITIQDIPAVPGSVAFDKALYAADESTVVTITVKRLGGKTGAISVDYDTVNGTALSGTHYTAASGTLNWADNDNADKTFNVTLSSVTELRWLTVELSNPGGSATLAEPYVAEIQILDTGRPIPIKPISDILADASDPMLTKVETLFHTQFFARKDIHAIQGNAIYTVPTPDTIFYAGATGSFNGGVDLDNSDPTLIGTPANRRHRIKQSRTILVMP